MTTLAIIMVVIAVVSYLCGYFLAYVRAAGKLQRHAHTGEVFTINGEAYVILPVAVRRPPPSHLTNGALE